MRRMICRGQTAAFLFVLSAKLSTRSNSFSAHSETHTHTHTQRERERERSDSHLLSKTMLIWYSEVFSGRTSHVRLRPLVQPGEFISIILHPVPERLQIQSKTNSADVSCTERRHHWVAVETISYKTLTDYQMLN